jgi:hypothetical protein
MPNEILPRKGGFAKMNYVEKLAEMLGIEVGVPFNTNEHENRYRFDADGTFSWECDGGYWSRDLVLTGHFLQEMLTVKWKPKQGEQCYLIAPEKIDGYLETKWVGYDIEKRLYDRGLVFRTKEEAIAKAKEYGWIK